MQGNLFGDRTDPIWNPARSLAAARAEYFAALKDGLACPCCDRYGKLYRRKFTTGMARCLLELYRRSRARGTAWIHLLREFSYEERGGEYGFLSAWGLAEAKMGQKEDGNPSVGLYRIVPAGMRFCEGKTRIPRRLWFYNDEVWRNEPEDTETIDIVEALGEKFNYRELMAEK